jgi:hypothetical protein
LSKSHPFILHDNDFVSPVIFGTQRIISFSITPLSVTMVIEPFATSVGSVAGITYIVILSPPVPVIAVRVWASSKKIQEVVVLAVQLLLI